MTLDEEKIQREADPVAWARAKINQLFDAVRADISLAYKGEFAEAMAIMYGADGEHRQFYRRTVDNLKPRIRAGDMESAVRRILREIQEQERAKAAAAGGMPGGTKKKSQATQLVELAANYDFFHSGDDGFASFENNGHLETHALKARSFRRWLSHQFMEAYGTAPNGEALSSAINTLSGRAVFKSPERPISVRIAGYDGRLYLDLCNAAWQVIEIDAYGWRLVESKDAPVRFRRAHYMLPLPEPARGGTIGALRPFINAANDADFRLAVTWLLVALCDRGPYPILCWYGEGGAAKSTAAAVKRRLMDPNKSPLRGPPREPRDLAIAAQNSWLLVFDNLSRIPEWLSDCLCRLATGGGFATRSLFTDDEEVIFESTRPVMITSIAEVVREPDLLDRGIFLIAPKIEETDRKEEKKFWAAFDNERPRILGALLDAVVVGLHQLPDVKLPKLPRMADFAMWGAAVAPALGWTQEEFLAAYNDNRAHASSLALENLVAVAVREVALPWEGTTTELLAELEKRFEVMDPDGRIRVHAKPRGWPGNAAALGAALRKLADPLRKVGIDVEFDRNTKSRKVYVKKVENPPARQSPWQHAPSSPSLPSSKSDGGQPKIQANTGGLSEYDSDDTDFPYSPKSGVGEENGRPEPPPAGAHRRQPGAKW